MKLILAVLMPFFVLCNAFAMETDFTKARGMFEQLRAGLKSSYAYGDDKPVNTSDKNAVGIKIASEVSLSTLKQIVISNIIKQIRAQFKLAIEQRRQGDGCDQIAYAVVLTSEINYGNHRELVSRLVFELMKREL